MLDAQDPDQVCSTLSEKEYKEYNESINNGLIEVTSTGFEAAAANCLTRFLSYSAPMVEL